MTIKRVTSRPELTFKQRLKIVKLTNQRGLNRYRRELLDKDPHCFYCETLIDFNTSSLDHRKPKSSKGSDDRSNLCLCCKKCNKAKGSLSEEDFIKTLPDSIRKKFQKEKVETNGKIPDHSRENVKTEEFRKTKITSWKAYNGRGRAEVAMENTSFSITDRYTRKLAAQAAREIVTEMMLNAAEDLTPPSKAVGGWSPKPIKGPKVVRIDPIE